MKLQLWQRTLNQNRQLQFLCGFKVLRWSQSLHSAPPESFSTEAASEEGWLLKESLNYNKKKANLPFAGTFGIQIFLKKIYSKRRYTRPEPNQTATQFSTKRYKSHSSSSMLVSWERLWRKLPTQVPSVQIAFTSRKSWVFCTTIHSPEGTKTAFQRTDTMLSRGGSSKSLSGQGMAVLRRILKISSFIFVFIFETSSNTKLTKNYVWRKINLFSWA